jgi:choline dehydrogenase-like flavoprotein
MRYQGYGQQLKDHIYEDYGTSVGFAGRGEMIPNKNSYCEIDPERVDQFGIPVLRFHFQWSDAEYNQVKHMHQTFASIIETMGGRVNNRPFDSKAAISAGGSIIHEAGSVRMGADPTTSVLNKYSQAHDVKNLFVCDAAPFVSNPDKNVTLSIVAFSWRASEYLIEEMRKGNV